MNAERGFELHPGAASDITSIWEFIANDNPLAAKRVREDILDAIRRLVPFPHQGHQRRDLTSRLRRPHACTRQLRRMSLQRSGAPELVPALQIFRSVTCPRTRLTGNWRLAIHVRIGWHAANEPLNRNVGRRFHYPRGSDSYLPRMETQRWNSP